MGKNKLAKFADLEVFPNVYQCPEKAVRAGEKLKKGDVEIGRGEWGTKVFGNDHPIVLELGCGRGEYTVALARLFPDKNFIGVDLKGARLWTGAKQALDEGLANVAFLRTGIEFLDYFFGANEVSEIWLTFSDPQMKKPTKRLTSTYFLERYRHLLVDNGLIHLKTDSQFLFTYPQYVVRTNQLPLKRELTDIYTEPLSDSEAKILHIRTYYEQQWLQRGITIKYLQFALPATGSLTEPDVEIEYDTYRSYNRQKRSGLDMGK